MCYVQLAGEPFKDLMCFPAPSSIPEGNEVNRVNKVSEVIMFSVYTLQNQ